MFQFPGFALPCLCIQQGMTLASRVSPFRDLRIKAFCQLPVAFRRLTRLSSPVIAKASTTCTYSLDPITLSPRHRCQGVIVFRIFNFYFRRIDFRYALPHLNPLPEGEEANERFANFKFYDPASA